MKLTSELINKIRANPINTIIPEKDTIDKYIICKKFILIINGLDFL